MTEPAPLSLSDDQLTAVLDAAAPLPVEVRDAFLHELATLLRSCDELGDGAVHRACRALQSRYFTPPNIAHDARSRRRLERA